MSQHIPNDILVEILARLPVKALLRFTLVCKHWYSIITNPSFVTTHLNRFGKTATDHLLIRLHDKKERYLLLSNDATFDKDFVELEFPFDGLKRNRFCIASSCNGLICLFESDLFDAPKNVMIWNPCIRKFVTLAPPKNPPRYCHVVIGFGFDLVKNLFKVVRITLDNDKRFNEQIISLEVEVYDQGGGKWRMIGCAPPRYNRTWFFNHSQVFLHRAVHWIAANLVENNFVHLIVVFEMGNETFRDITLPSSISCMSRLSVSKFKDSLAVFYESLSPSEITVFHVWMMGEYGVFESWTNLYTINLPFVLKTPFGFRKNGKILFMSKEGALLSYNRETNCFKQASPQGSVVKWTVMNFVESLVLLK